MKRHLALVYFKAPFRAFLEALITWISGLSFKELYGGSWICGNGNMEIFHFIKTMDVELRYREFKWLH